MKRVIVSILALCLLSACSLRMEDTAPVNDTIIPAEDEIFAESEKNDFSIKVMASEGFDNCGFTHFACPTSGTYRFTASENDEMEWTVYVLDEEFQGANRYISHGPYHEPVLEGDGAVWIEEGKYIYIQCSVNGFTTDTPNTTEYIEITLE